MTECRAHFTRGYGLRTDRDGEIAHRIRLEPEADTKLARGKRIAAAGKRDAAGRRGADRRGGSAEIGEAGLCRGRAGEDNGT
jgi:hypothetical protein